MSTFLLIPLDTQGTFTDTAIVQALADAASAASNISDVFLFSHGWWTNADTSMVDYDRFTAGFDRALGTDATTRGLVQQNMQSFITAGVHWPSVLTEDAANPLNYAEAASYYVMRERADDVGRNGGYAILQSAVGPEISRVQLIGHSFGCRVVCSALSKFIASTAGRAASLPDTRFNIVLLEAAYDQGDLAPGGAYANLLTDARVRLLVTHSAKDWSLFSAYPLANLVWDMVNHPGFASVAKTLPDLLKTALANGSGAAALAGQLADRFVHLNAATPAAQPSLVGALQNVLTARLPTAGANLEKLGMELLAQAATVLGHNVAQALGGQGPLPAVITTMGAAASNVTLDMGWPVQAPAGMPGPPLGIPGAKAALAQTKRLVVADLTPLHTAREPVAWPGPDHHSDINALEIYRLVAGFLLA